MIEQVPERQELQKAILEFIGSVGDQRQRDQIAFAFYGDCGSPNWGSLARGTLLLLLAGGGKSRFKLARGVELIHHASLVVDDQIDKAILRRSQRAFWVKFGFEDGIIIAHMLMSMALTELSEFDREHNAGGDAHTFALRAIQAMADAELESGHKPVDSLRSYLCRTSRKTGSLYRLVGYLAGLAPRSVIQNVEPCTTALEMIGNAHQMLDDLIDAHPSREADSVFLTRAAAKENRRRSIFHLCEFGLSEKLLRTFHYDYSCRAIDLLIPCFKIGFETQVVKSLCEKICFGSRVMNKKDVPIRIRKALGSAERRCTPRSALLMGHETPIVR